MAESAPVGIAGLAVTSALGRGAETQLAAVLSGAAAFGPVNRFDTTGRRVTVAATLPDVASLPVELAIAVADACTEAGLGRPERSSTPLFLAVHGHPSVPGQAAGLAEAAGLAGVGRVYTTACVSASTAVAAAASLISRGELDRAVVAAGYLVESDQFALFDAGKALAVDGVARPFSRDRQGLLLGDAVAAVVLESGRSSAGRGRQPIAQLVGWGRAGDAHHPCQPAPDGRGLARAVEAALGRAGVSAEQLGYINANATGTQLSDAAEAAALCTALGPVAGRVPISSTKSMHGHALEASALLELVITVLSLVEGKLGVNAGYLGPDPDCPLDLIVDGPRQLSAPYALSLNSAFGGANTALLVRAA
jgi:3-oxoacyl-[acyl-carrier-protein] synthase II